MLAYDGSHILHTAIAYFDVVLVEKGVIFVLSREMFRYELRKVLPFILYNNYCFTLLRF